MAKKKEVKEDVKVVEVTPEGTTIEVTPAPKVQEPIQEEPKVEVCPENACGDLRFGWEKGIRGCYDPNSNWCTTCGKDFPETQVVCKEGTINKLVEKAKIKAERKQRTPGKPTQVSFLDNALTIGSTIQEMVKGLIEEGLSDRDESVTKRRVLKHIHHLRTEEHHKLTVENVNGVYRIVS